MNEKRRHQRIKFGFQIKNETGKKIWIAEDISVGGCFIKALESMPIGSKINLVFQIPGSSRYVEALGEVKRFQENGMGIEFVNMEDTGRDEVEGFVKDFTKFQD